MAPDGCAASNADAAAEDRVRADPAVVADLHLIIDLDAILDHRVVDRAAVDRGVGSNADIRTDGQAAELRDASGAPDDARMAPFQERFRAAIGDDLNTPRALAVVFDVLARLLRLLRVGCMLPVWISTTATMRM